MFLNLYPDMGRSQYTKNDTFVYAAPITTDVWMQLQKYARHDGEKNGFLLPDDIEGLDDVIILRSKHMTDDDCMTTQAFIRLVHGNRERVYCVPYRDQVSTAVLANATAGAPRALCKMLSLDIRKIEEKENEDPQTI